MPSSSSSRPFSTVTPVYPNYLPTLHKSSRMEKRLVAATIAAVGVGYGIAAVRDTGAFAYSSSSPTTTTTKTPSSSRKSSTDSNASTSSSKSSSYHRYSSADDNNSQKRKEMAMLDAYGDRGSLEELEAAVAAYTAQHQRRK